MAELISGRALWPGKTDIDQLHLICTTLGELNQRLMKIFQNNGLYKGVIFPKPVKYRSLEEQIPRASEIQISLLLKCFEKNPDHRWTCIQLLNHEYFRNFNFQTNKLHNTQHNSSKVIVLKLLTASRLNIQFCT